MARDDAYMSTAEFKARAGLQDSRLDGPVTSALLMASRQVERWCGLDARTSFNQSAPNTTLYFTPTDPWWLDVPDCVAVQEIATDFGKRDYPNVWQATDFDLYPIDADSANRPFRQIRTRPFGKFTFPAPMGGWTAAPLALPSGIYPRETGLTRGVRIAATWGWPAVPDVIKEAVYMIANRQKAIWSAPFGVMGSGQLGQARASASDLDPIVLGMLSAYRVVTI